MQQSKAIIVGSVVIGTCILAFLGYTISRDRARAEAARQLQHQETLDALDAQYNRLKEEGYQYRLDAYEAEFGYDERRFLEAYVSGVRGYGLIQRACYELNLSPKGCDAMEKNRQILFRGVVGERFIKPPTH
jgi:hypothetical protein